MAIVGCLPWLVVLHALDADDDTRAHAALAMSVSGRVRQEESLSENFMVRDLERESSSGLRRI